MLNLSYTLFAIGSLICFLNFYLSILRYPVYWALGWKYEWVSGLPVFGSLILLFAAISFHDSPLMFWSGIVMALLDTGGLHWFLGIMLYMLLFPRETMKGGDEPSAA